MSLISRLKAVVAGDEYLDDDFEDLDYDDEKLLSFTSWLIDSQGNITNNISSSNLSGLEVRMLW